MHINFALIFLLLLDRLLKCRRLKILKFLNVQFIHMFIKVFLFDRSSGLSLVKVRKGNNYGLYSCVCFCVSITVKM